LKKVEDILAECIEDIRAGRTTLEECLARYASMRTQLEPLLRLALSIRKPPSFAPSTAFKVRTRVRLMDYIHDNRQRKPWYSSIGENLARGWRAGWLKTASIVLVIVLFLSASGTGTAYASQESLPGDVLYPVKKATESIRRTFTFDNDEQLNLELSLADTRLEEMEVLAVKNPQQIDSAIDGYRNNLALAVEKAEAAGDKGEHRQRLETVALETLRHISVIDGINDALSGDEGTPLRVASETALNAQLRVLRALAVEDPLGAMEINYQAMQNRLKRAGNAADEGKTSACEDALGQVQEMSEFGQEISRMARQAGHDTADIDVLNEQAASEQAEIMKRMHGKVQDEATNPAEDSGATPAEGHGNGKGTGSMSGKGQDNNTTASDNATQDITSSQEEPAGTSESPASPPENPGNTGESPGEPDNSPPGPGSPPEEPSSGNSGNGKS
jgi:hypothetical protein